MNNDSGVIAVLRARTADDYQPIARVLAEAGIAIELTLTTPGTVDTLHALRRSLPPGTDLGVGTVLTSEEAQAATDAGAQFLVTPNANPDVIDFAVERGLPVFAGALTPTEAHSNWSRGATAVKLFPASVVGPAYVSLLRGPFPSMPIVPSGGVTLDAIAAWMLAGSLAVSLGSPLVGDAFAGGDLDALRSRANTAVESVATARRQL